MRTVLLALLALILIVMGASAAWCFLHGTSPLIIWVAVLCAGALVSLIKETR